MKTPKQKIDEVLDRLGISGVKASAMMRMPHTTFRKNMMDNSKSYKFTDKNYSDLLDYLINEIKYLVLAKNENEKVVDPVQYVNDTLTEIFKNYKTLSTQEGWVFEEEIIKVLDYMEEPEAFSDMKEYSDIIDTIESKTKRLKQPFDLHAYTNHTHNDKGAKHDRWYEYLGYRRKQIILKILE